MEWQWSPNEDLPDNPAPKFIKEAGLDVVVWRQWPDRRTGQLYLLGAMRLRQGLVRQGQGSGLHNCSRGSNCRAFCRFGDSLRPATPPDLLAEMSRKAGLVFDRVRIVEALRAPHTVEQLAQLQPKIDACFNIAVFQAP